MIQYAQEKNGKRTATKVRFKFNMNESFLNESWDSESKVESP